MYYKLLNAPYISFNNSHSNSIQLSLALIHNWSVRWQPPINRSKTKHWHLGTDAICPAFFPLTTSRIPVVDNLIDLGIDTTFKLTYSRHIALSLSVTFIAAFTHKYFTSSSCLYYVCPSHSRILFSRLEPWYTQIFKRTWTCSAPLHRSNTILATSLLPRTPCNSWH